MLKMGLDFFLCDKESMISSDGHLCILALSVFLGVPAGVLTGDGLGLTGIVEAERWTLEGETVMGAFLMLSF